VGVDEPSAGCVVGGVAGGVAAGGSNANSIDEAAKTHAKVATLTSARGDVRRVDFMGIFRFDVWFRRWRSQAKDTQNDSALNSAQHSSRAAFIPRSIHPTQH
jgi:hypothetical protein